MKEFKDYYSQDQIIKYLCKIRIKYSNKRKKIYQLNKLTNPKNYVYKKESDYDNEILRQLDEILPKRRLWLTNGQRTFKIVNNKITLKKELKKIDTDEKNREILFNTIKHYLNKKPQFDFVLKLKIFVEEIQSAIENEIYKIESPDIIPEIKETNKSKRKLQIKKLSALECRPISRFTLKDRIVLSLTNKFLTVIFDDFFEESSLAFRAKRDEDLTDKSHHLAISKIIEFRHLNKDNDLFVSECDMKKFFDTVNHNLCETFFDNLIEKVKKIHPQLELSKAIYLFKEYFKCYSFRENVLILNNKKYWDKQKNTRGQNINGFYPWVEFEYTNSTFYKKNSDERIGVPQGGALSGLIANILLDYADKKLKNIANLFYVRYCDDMILMHSDKETCNDAINIYIKTINELHLYNHPIENDFFNLNKNYKSKVGDIEIDRIVNTKQSKHLNRSYKYSIKSFWNFKSKGPYRWGEIDVENNILPWIGFVGYEISYKGETRVRKKSIKKEIEKQKRVVTSIIKIISKKKKARNNTIFKSAMEKLNGMSVGRINLYNYESCENKICWADGFQNLNLNKYSKKQLRILDKNKYKYLSILDKKIGTDTAKSKKPKDNPDILKMQKPFSYFYQVGEKKLKKNEA